MGGNLELGSEGFYCCFLKFGRLEPEQDWGRT